LKAETDRFRERLSPQRVLQTWLSTVKDAAAFEVTGNVFRVGGSKAAITGGGSGGSGGSGGGGGRVLSLHVNFADAVVAVFKEVRALSTLNLTKSIPYALRYVAAEARAKYPLAVRLRETVRM
jgi:hypothetical protein